MRFKDLQAKISIHALRVEGDSEQNHYCDKEVISIHALRVEGDRVESGSAFTHVGISIHALRVEGDLCVVVALQ